LVIKDKNANGIQHRCSSFILKIENLLCENTFG